MVLYDDIEYYFLCHHSTQEEHLDSLKTAINKSQHNNNVLISITVKQCIVDWHILSPYVPHSIDNWSKYSQADKAKKTTDRESIII